MRRNLHPPIPPEAPSEIQLAVAWCHDCKEVIGPGLSESVGEKVGIGDHQGHDTMLVDEWTESPSETQEDQR